MPDHVDTKPNSMILVTSDAAVASVFLDVLKGKTPMFDLGVLGKDWFASEVEIKPMNGGFTAAITFKQVVHTNDR